MSTQRPNPNFEHVRDTLRRLWNDAADRMIPPYLIRLELEDGRILVGRMSAIGADESGPGIRLKHDDSREVEQISVYDIRRVELEKIE